MCVCVWRKGRVARHSRISGCMRSPLYVGALNLMPESMSAATMWMPAVIMSHCRVLSVLAMSAIMASQSCGGGTAILGMGQLGGEGAETWGNDERLAAGARTVRHEKV